jgi:hypothetical protein
MEAERPNAGKPAQCFPIIHECHSRASKGRYARAAGAHNAFQGRWNGAARPVGASRGRAEKCAFAACISHYEIAYRNLKKANTTGRIVKLIFMNLKIR